MKLDFHHGLAPSNANTSHWQCWKALQYPGPLKGLLLSEAGLETGIRSHFLTISATGSGRQTVLAPKEATPIWGERTLERLHHCLEGQAKNSREDNGRFPTPTTQQEEFRGEVLLFIPPNFHISLREIIWVSSVTKTATSARILITAKWYSGVIL